MDVLRMNITVAEVLKSYKGLFHNESMMFFRDVMAGWRSGCSGRSASIL